ncbi:MAG: family 16 glycoside hydrolase [Opitutaceae bacterium]
MKPGILTLGLLLFLSLRFAYAAESGTPLADLAREAARRLESPQHPPAFDALLLTLEQTAERSVDERLHYAWAGFLLASSDDQRERVLKVAAGIADARARMLIGSFREFPELRKAYAAADRTHSALILKPGGASEKKRTPRDLYGINPFDAPSSADRWEDPYGVVGRWRADNVTVDIVAFPAGNFLGLLHRPGREPSRLLGELQGGVLLLVGRDAQGRLEQGRFSFTHHTRTQVLVRTPVGVTSFDQRPTGSRVLLDDHTGLQHFRHAKGEAGWKLLPGGVIEIEPSKGSLFTQDTFADLHGYLEFRHAYNSESLGPRRGNSGLYLFNTYEVQLVDSFALPPSETSEGSVYHIAAPKVTASAPPLEWQSLEFKFRAPRFDAGGTKTANARLTLWLNGVLIQDDLEIPNPTAGSVAGGKALKDPSPPQPLMLQNHGNLLQFRRIWVQPTTN